MGQELVKKQYDVIIIGSGIGSLAAGGMLAKAQGKKILILEQHDNIGGLTHEFGRGSYQWDVGLHYVGDLAKGSLFRELMDYITDDAVDWQKMQSPFEKFIFPDVTVSQPDDAEQYVKELKNLFPNCQPEIDRYFRDIRRVSAWYQYHNLRRSAPFVVYAPSFVSGFAGRQLFTMTTAEYMAKYIPASKLRALLTAQWGDYGLPPDKSSFGVHALIANHYLKGAWYPVGGAQSIALAIEQTIRQHGGAIFPGKLVKRIIIDDTGTARGVEVIDRYSQNHDGFTVTAPVIISDAGLRTTYGNLIQHASVAKIQAEIKQFSAGSSAVTVYYGLKESPATLGLHGENIWIRSDYDDDIEQLTKDLLAGKLRHCYLSLPSAKDPKTTKHTAIAIALVDMAAFSKFTGDWQKRTTDYYEMKDRVARGLTALIEQYVPGFSEAVAVTEVSTPLTIQHFTERAGGEMYGIADIPRRHKVSWLGPKTPVKNLFISGSDAFSVGIEGAFFGGMAAASQAVGAWGMVRLVGKVKADAHRPKTLLPDNQLPLSADNVIIDAIIQKITALDACTYEISFETLADLPFIAGQHIALRISQSDWRYYSVVSFANGIITLLISTRPGGPGSQFIERLKSEQKVTIKAPFGSYRVAGGDRDITFVATGTGLAPFVPMLERLATIDYAGSVDLIYGADSQKTDYSGRYLSDVIKKLKLTIHHCFSAIGSKDEGFHGRVTGYLPTYLGKAAHNKRDYYVCGNPYMVNDIAAQLRKHSITSVFVEGY